MSEEEEKKEEKQELVEKPKLKFNRPTHPKGIKYYIFFEAKSEAEMVKYYEYLRELEEVSEENGYTRMQVQIKAVKDIPMVPSLIANCYRSFDENYIWYSGTQGKKGSYLVRLKNNYSLPDPDDLLQLIDDTIMYHEDDSVVILKYLADC